MQDARLSDEDVLSEFRAADALLEGHFILSSGLRSSRYLQCARVLMDPARAERLARALAVKIPAEVKASAKAVIAPAMGGLICGYELARALGIDSMFVERPTGTFELRRGFRLAPGTPVILMEDVVTTGLSSREAIRAVEAAGGKVIHAASLVDRSNGAADLGVPFTPLIRLSVPSYQPDELPPELAAIPAVKPGKPRGVTISPRGGTGRLRLGVNIDHVATIRNARGGAHPSPLRAAELATAAGADGITAHLREDRRHMTDADIAELVTGIALPLNLEMAATDEMLAIALKHRPHAACIVPERRAERTTEGGLDAAGQHNHLAPLIERLSAAGIRVSLFIAPDPRQIEMAARLGAPVVELHTGPYAHGEPGALRALSDGAALAQSLGLEVHAGHGLTFDNVGPVAEIPAFAELNIGHFLIGEALFIGLEASIRQMRSLMDAARAVESRQ